VTDAQLNPEQRSRPARRRSSLLPASMAGLLLAEYLVLSLSYDALPLRMAPGALAVLGGLGSLAPVFAVVGAVVVALFGPRLRGAWDATVAAGSSRAGGWAWLVLHAAAFATLYALTDRLFGGEGLSERAPLWVLGWVTASVLVVLSAVFVVASPRRVAALLRSVAPMLWGGFAIGVAAWLAGWASLSLWDAIGEVTLYGVAALLQPFVSELVFDPLFSEVGSQTFYVKVDPACSGYEGLGLISVFMAFYLWTARSSLRFPRAWLLLPLALGLVFIGNIVRIAALILVGIHASPQIALGGFHSKAGWILFCGIGLGISAWSRRSGWFALEPLAGVPVENPVAPFVAPLLAVIAVSLATGLFATDIDRAYGLRALAGGLTLLALRDRLPRRLWHLSLEALGVGALVFVLWLALAPVPPEEVVNSWRHALDSLSPVERVGWIGAKLLGSVLVIPLVEELAFRGYLLRRVLRPDFESVPWQRLTWTSVLLSSLAFGALHQEWVAGTVAGVLFAILQSRRGNLGEAVIAHAVANALIAIWVLALGRADLWM